MDKEQLTLLGAVVSLIGCLTIFLTWVEIYYVDYYGPITFTYSGLGLITSGDFTNPEGILYGKVGPLGVYTPTLVCIAFGFMAARFIVKVKRDYLTDVILTSILIIISSIYMIWWVHPGNFYGYDYTEVHEFGPGPIVSIILAVIGAFIAYNIDQIGTSGKSKTGHARKIPVQQPPVYVRYCSHCGNGLTKDELEYSKYCTYCGSILQFDTEDEDE